MCSLNNKKGSWEKTIYLSPLTLSEYWMFLVPAGLAIFWEGVKWWPTCTRFTQETSAPWPTWLRLSFQPCFLWILCSRASRRLRPWAQERNCSCLGGRWSERTRKGGKGGSLLWGGWDLVINEINCGLFRHLSISWWCLFVCYFLFNTHMEKITRTTKLSLFTANMHFWSRIRILCCLTFATLSNINSF